MKQIRKIIVSIIIIGVLATLVISLLKGKSEKSENNGKNSEDYNATLIDASSTSPENNTIISDDMSDSVQEDTNIQVGLGDEYISNGIGIRVNSVIITDADEELLDLFPTFSDLTSWDEGCISTLDFAEMYGKRMEKNGDPLTFFWKPMYRLIMDIEFHNYNEYESVSPLGRGDFRMTIFDDGVCMADGEFVPKYNSVFHREENEHHVHDFSIAAGADYKATFVFNIYPLENIENRLSESPSLVKSGIARFHFLFSPTFFAKSS